MDSASNMKAEVLFEYVFSEDESETAGRRRFVVRVLRFVDTNTQSVGISRQWFDTVSKSWLPGKKGHVYFPFKSWCDLTENIASIDNTLRATLGFVNGVERIIDGRVGPHNEGNSGPGYAPNNATITATDNIGDRVPTTSGDRVDGHSTSPTQAQKYDGAHCGGRNVTNSNGGGSARGGSSQHGSKRKHL